MLMQSMGPLCMYKQENASKTWKYAQKTFTLHL